MILSDYEVNEWGEYVVVLCCVVLYTCQFSTQFNELALHFSVASGSGDLGYRRCFIILQNHPDSHILTRILDYGEVPNDTQR